ncbi:hypothetical protein [Luteococcus peritonei]|uniref:Uncharacterized protein n=1 Tax=Luteococcus peritonei TaxID=88874 RepID=A0ABW4RSJ0_9ACTN
MMYALALVVGLWMTALLVVALAGRSTADIDRALSSDEQIVVSTPELIPPTPAPWSRSDHPVVAA